MRKLYIVKKSKDFEHIINENNCKKNKSFVIYYLENNLKYNRYGISVSKKLGNAVFRNKYKRIIRSIIDNYKKDYIISKDYIIILRRGALSKKYNELKDDLESLLKGETHEKE